MFKYLVLAVALVMVFSGLALADSSNTAHTINQTAVGNNESCPALFTPYVAKTFKDVIGEADVRVELNYTGSVRDFTENNSVGIKAGLEF